MGILLAAIYPLLPLLFIRYCWKAHVRRFPEARFNYTVVEIWAAIIGLTPTFYLITRSIEGWSANDDTLAVVSIISGSHQLAGIFLAKLSTPQTPQRTLELAWTVIFGSMIGFVSIVAVPGLLICAAAALGVVAMLIWSLYFLVHLAFTQPAFALPVLLFFAAFYFILSGYGEETK
ncbi:MAG TPA: hypothetical protein VEK08_02410 [Planctomycetota bacterium]|nr:hypothetical protein [Planctomycetota bacterium]